MTPAMDTRRGDSTSALVAAETRLWQAQAELERLVSRRTCIARTTAANCILERRDEAQVEVVTARVNAWVTDDAIRAALLAVKTAAKDLEDARDALTASTDRASGSYAAAKARRS